MVTGQVSNLFDNIVFLDYISNISKIVSQWTCNYFVWKFVLAEKADW